MFFINYEYYKKLSVSDKRKLTMKGNKELKELQKDPINNKSNILKLIFIALI